MQYNTRLTQQLCAQLYLISTKHIQQFLQDIHLWRTGTTTN